IRRSRGSPSRSSTTTSTTASAVRSLPATSGTRRRRPTSCSPRCGGSRRRSRCGDDRRGRGRARALAGAQFRLRDDLGGAVGPADRRRARRLRAELVLAVEFLSQGLGIERHARNAKVVMASVSWNYTTYLNIVFL